jgi:hypothetical protein
METGMNATDETPKSEERQSPSPFDRVLSIAEVCEILGICRRTFYNNPLPTVQISARRRGVRQSTLQAWLTEREAA